MTLVAHERVGSADQAALATRRAALDLRPLRGIELRIYPERGLDVGAAWFRGYPLGWVSPVGEGGDETGDWRSSWGGGLITTCGLDNVGAPSEGLGLHGTYTFLDARDVELGRGDDSVWCSATVADPRGLEVRRTIRTSLGEGRIELVDKTRNLASERLEAPLLYHVNLGWPLWDVGAQVESDARDVLPRDDDAALHDWGAAPETAALPERVWEHVGVVRTAVVNEQRGLRVAVESSLPRLWQWVDPRPNYYALALEPANCSVLGRAHDRAEGTLPFLEPGEERVTSVVVTAEVT